MATISTTEGQSFSVAAPSCGILVRDRVHDQFFGQIPFVYIDGHALNIASVDGDGIGAHAALVTTTGATPPSTFPTVVNEAVALNHFAATLEVDSMVLTQYGNRRNMLRSLLDVKVASLVELFRNHLVNSVGLDGLLTVGFSNKLGRSAGAIAAGEVEAMLALLRPGENVSNRYLVMHAEALAHLRGGAYQGDVYYIQHPELGPLPAIGGVPVLVDDHIPTNQGAGNETSVVGVVLDPVHGYRGVVPCARRGREVLVTGPSLQEGTDTAVFHLSLTAGTGVPTNSKAVAMVDQVTL